MKHKRFEGLAELEAYWHALRGNRLVPTRSEIDPRGIENTLDFAFIVERAAPGVARFRLAGSQLNELLGMDVRGMPITSFFASDVRHTMSEVIEAVFAGPEILEAQFTSPAGAGRSELPAQLLLLPLESDLGDISRAIGCFATRGEMGRAPRRFTLDGAPQRRALGFASPEPTTLLEAAEEPAVFEAKADGDDQDRHPHLRVVRDDD
ncbi:MAG: PAS domain-containing protein [Shimia sp.]